MADAKIDLFREHKDEYVSPRKPVFVKVGPASYLSVTGKGEPGGPEFQAKVGALYAMAYSLKMDRKKSGGEDYKIATLEGLYWTDGDSQDFTDVPKSEWQWQLLIRTPDFITASDVKKTAKTLLAKGKDPGVSDVKLTKLREGLCVQMLHVGPYSQEQSTIEAMNALASLEGKSVNGKHHEIYLSDPKRVAPEKLKTILRLPVKPVA